jgi:hypothetical protein
MNRQLVTKKAEMVSSMVKAGAKNGQLMMQKAETVKNVGDEGSKEGGDGRSSEKADAVIAARHHASNRLDIVDSVCVGSTSGFWRQPWVVYGMTWQLAGVVLDENAHTFSLADMSGGRRQCRDVAFCWCCVDGSACASEGRHLESSYAVYGMIRLSARTSVRQTHETV